MSTPTRLDNPVSVLSGKRVSEISVVRLFGTTTDNASCCVNFHGYFPRLYMDEVDGMDIESLCGLLDLKLGAGDQPIVYNITRQERVNFYGYTNESISVFCVEIFNPSDLNRLAEFASTTLRTFRGVPVRIFEVHIPYLLNFLIDYGIQGVTPFYLSASLLSVPACRTSRCTVELSTRVDAIMLKSTDENSSHPVPPPLAGAARVCSTFQSLWEEEFLRLSPGEPFPYYPEGLVDGLNRPDAMDMPIVRVVSDFSTQDLVNELEAMPKFTPTVEQLTCTAVQYTHNDPGAETLEQATIGHTFADPTQIWPGNIVLPENSEIPTLPVPEQSPEQQTTTPSWLPNGGCVLRYNSQQLFSSVAPTGVSQIVHQAPSRSTRAMIEQTQEFVHEDGCSFGTLCVVESNSQTGEIACIFVTAEQIHSQKNFQTDSQFVQAFLQFDPGVVVSWDATRETIGPLLTRLAGTNCAIGRSLLEPDQVPVPTRHYSGHRGSHAHLSGRLVLDLWKVLRKDTDLRLATTDFEGVVAAVLGEVVPHICNAPKKASLTLRLLEQTRVMENAVEMARLLGMDLESTFIRGSQFRVECILIRAARSEGFLLPSSSRQQVRSQPGPMGVPLILEPPGAGLITDPVAVLDFQSLYPSVIVGYNICYSTCLGRVDTNGLLGTQPYTPPNPLPKAAVLPGEVMFVPRSTRVGLLPRICHEILQTRIMVKRAMKAGNKSPARLRQLDARQLTLKLLINVMYGYTTASFTGRMPCVEVADAILLTARKSLEVVMANTCQITSSAKVVYGDTDSLFVQIPDGTVQSAFEWGSQLVDFVAQSNPWPMKLVMEKVYAPCCLMKMKRYVGRAYDTPEGPWRIDAKGIETIRRDTCPAVAVTVERVVKAVFEASSDHSTVLENAVIEEFIKLLSGKVPLQYFIFQNQVRDKEYYKDVNNLPAAARVAADQGIETVRGDRVAFVITQGPLGSKLTEQVHPPQAIIELDERKRMRLNIEYYLTKQVIPSIQRIFGPIANSAFLWLATAKSRKGDFEDIAPTVLDIAQKKNCLLCKSVTASSIFRNAHVPLFCSHCVTHRESQCVFAVENEVAKLEKKCSQIRKVCLNCCAGIDTDVENCRDAFHCSVYFERETAKIKLRRAYNRRTELALFRNHFDSF